MRIDQLLGVCLRLNTRNEDLIRLALGRWQLQALRQRSQFEAECLAAEWQKIVDAVQSHTCDAAGHGMRLPPREVACEHRHGHIRRRPCQRSLALPGCPLSSHRKA
jgi:hypothetical protein